MTTSKATAAADLGSEISNLKSQSSEQPQISDLKSSQPVREGFHTVTPYLAVKEAPQLIEFVKKAFDAEGKIYGIGSEGGLHAEYKIGDSIFTWTTLTLSISVPGCRCHLNEWAD